MKRAPQPKRVALAKIKDDLSRYLRLAASEEIVITRPNKRMQRRCAFSVIRSFKDHQTEELFRYDPYGRTF